MIFVPYLCGDLLGDYSEELQYLVFSDG